jgi:hypothetical protein
MIFGLAHARAFSAAGGPPGLRQPVAILVAVAQQWLAGASLEGSNSRVLTMVASMSNGQKVAIPTGLALAGFAAAPASAQEGQVIQQGDVDQVAPENEVDRVVGPQRGTGFRTPEGVRVVRPGALLFASFDRNYDGRISSQEIEAGAAGAFAVADRNGDGAVSGFEQNDWAASVGSMNDVLSNPMTFDVDLDRSVTREEFTAGLLRIAGQLAPEGLTFADLMKPLSRSEDQASRGGSAPAAPGQRGPNASVF